MTAVTVSSDPVPRGLPMDCALYGYALGHIGSFKDHNLKKVTTNLLFADKFVAKIKFDQK